MFSNIEIFAALSIIASCIASVIYGYSFIMGFKKSSNAEVIQLQSYRDMKLGREFRNLKNLSDFQKIEKLDELLRQVE